MFSLAFYRYKRFWLILGFPVSFLLLHLISYVPEQVERWYSRGIYSGLVAVFGRLSSLLPFSLADTCIILAPVLLVACAVRHRLRRCNGPVSIHAYKRRRLSLLHLLIPLLSLVVFVMVFFLISWQWSAVCLIIFLAGYLLFCCRTGTGVSGSSVFHRTIATLCAVISCLYLVFALFCAPNYHRLTFAQQTGLEVRPSSAEELAELCAWLGEEAGRLRELLPEHPDSTMALSASPMETARKAQSLYTRAAMDYPMLGGYIARAKPTVFSRVMSWMNLSGIYIAFLFEPNFNADMVDYNIPATIMHEMSHNRGYMREDEANFLAWLTCRYSDDPEFQYSGYMMALLHSTNALYRTDQELYYEVMEPISIKVRYDFAMNNAYWNQFEGPVAEVSTTVNDVYLKTNKQQSGVKSYGEMVDLLLAEFRAERAI